MSNRSTDGSPRNESKRSYARPSITTYDARDLRAILGVAQAMTSTGDGGGGLDTFPNALGGGSGRPGSGSLR